MKTIIIGLLNFLIGFIMGEYLFKTDYYEVPVDHFSFTNNKTFLMKYLVNDSWWAEGGPIFFYTGNEGSIELFAQNTGFMWEIAPKFNALLLFAEHRYYGTSLPFGNESYSSPDKTGYLTSEQALADYADFLLFYKNHKNCEKSPIIAFGGSYGGMLTAWMRMKYPHIVQGGIAASAPILQFPDMAPCGVFSKILTRSFERESKECVQIVKSSWSLINNYAKSEAGLEWLSTNWKLCDKLNENDLGNLKDWLVNIYANLAMVNYPYPSNFLAPLPGYPVKVFCSKLTSANYSSDPNISDKDVLKAIFKGLNFYFNYTGSTTCLNIQNQADPSIGDRGWDYQACTEMVMPMCSNGIDDFFEPLEWDLASYEAKCFQKYGVKTRPLMAQIIYGGKKLAAASNIVFSNGLLDPWSGGGVLKNISSSVLAILIPEGAHHLDLRSQNANDPLSVKFARNFEMTQIRKWIHEYEWNSKLGNK